MGARTKRLSDLQKTFLLALGIIGAVLLFSILAILVARNAYVTGKNDIYALEKQEKLDQLINSLETDISVAEQQQLKLLSDSKVGRIVYTRDEMLPYDYYTSVLDIVGRMKEITEDFRIVRNVYLLFNTTGVLLNQDGPVSSVPLSGEQVSEAAGQKMICLDQRPYIVRSLMDYQARETAALCVLILELDADALYERCAFLCSENESVALTLNGVTVRNGGEPQSSGGRSVTGDMGQYPLNASLSLGATHYRLYTDSLLTSASIGVGVACLLAAAFLLYAYLKLYRPLELLLDEAFLHLEKGELSYRIPGKGSGAFAGVFNTFNHSVEQLEYLMDHVYQQKLLISEMQLKQLQAQINPHFMYNTYYTLYRLIQDGNWQSSRQLARLLGDFYRYITRSGGMEKSLREEVQHTLTYVEIQTMRFPDTVQEIMPLPEEIAMMTVPQLIMQPVFENVFQHAQKNLHPGEPLHLILRYQVQEERVCIYIENNGILSDDAVRRLQEMLEHADQQKETTGLLNIHKRLQLFYGKDAGLTVEKSRLDGLCVCMRLIR